MSALIRESHANNLTPLFLSAGGGVISGNVTVTGNLQVDGDANVDQNLTVTQNIGSGANLSAAGTLVVDGLSTLAGGANVDGVVNVYSSDTAPLPALQIVPVAGPPEKVELRTDGSIGFGVLNLAVPPQTTFIPSATPNADVLTVGGALIAQEIQGIGPAPVTLINSTKNETPAPVSPAPAVAFGVDNLVATVVGGEYDVMSRGIITLAAGVADPDDIVNVTLDAGTAIPAVWVYQFKPSAVGNNGYWQIRDRVVSDAIVPSIGISVQVLRAGASTADYDVSQVQFDVTRVI